MSYRVSIRARPHGRAMHLRAGCFFGTVEVSIRARPHGRAMHPKLIEVLVSPMFQSAPGLTVGRCPRRCPATPRSNCFNPRPASRSGDAAQIAADLGYTFVSIRARPHGRAMRKTVVLSKVLYDVSIRARPHGRAMRNGL